MAPLLNKHLLFLSWAAIIAGFGFHASAQQYKLEDLKARFPNDERVNLDINEKLVFTSGKKLEMRDITAEKAIYLTERAKEYNQWVLEYTPMFDSITKVNAKTLIPDGKGGYKSMKIDDLGDRRAESDGIFYQDTKKKVIVFSGMQEGAIADLSYTQEFYDPHFIGGFNMQRYTPILHERYEVEFPSSVRLKYIFKGDSTGVRFTKEVGKNTTRYIWEANDVARLPYENDAPSASYFIPHVLLYVESYDSAGKEVTVYKDVKTLYKWYSGLIGHLADKPDDAVKTVVDSLVKGETDDYRKMSKIFYWMENHVKYVAFEDGLGGYIPREATDVVRKRYGDCKDMANCLYVMMNYAGIKAYRTWIGTRSIPYRYDEVPTGSVDNHMIVEAEVNGKTYFLDATGGIIPADLPTPMIQGKQALVGLSRSDYRLMTVPVVPKEKNLILDTTYLKIEGNVVTGSGKSWYTGFERLWTVSPFIGLSESKLREELLDGFHRGNNKSTVTRLRWAGLGSNDSAFLIDYDFKVPDYIIQNGNEMYVNMCLDKVLREMYIDTAFKKLDKEFDHKRSYETITSLEVPAGYRISKIPPDVKYNGSNYGMEITYKQENNRIVKREFFYIDTLLLPKSSFDDWNKMIRKAQDGYRQTVVFTR